MPFPNDLRAKVLKSKSNNSWINGLNRLIRYRLLIPLKRSAHSPEYTARGVMVGMVWAMTPTVGIQMGLVFGTWLFTRKFFKWDFSLINGMAWTWTTNVFTLIPIYYTFYITGQLMMGRFDDLSGYDSFIKLWDIAFDPNIGFSDTTIMWFDTLIRGWGLPMLIGSLPWAALSGWAAYVLSLRFVISYRERRFNKEKRLN
jgi:uncharacterized protein